MKYFIFLTLLISSLQVLANSPKRMTFHKKTNKPTHTGHRGISGTETPSTDKIRVSFTGDLLIHNDLYKKVIATENHDFSILWQKTIPLFEKADFSYLNLEGPVALGIDKKLKDRGDVGFIYDRDVYSGTDFLFNYHPSLITALQKTGVDLVSTANNHTFDRGSIGVDRSIDALNEHKMNFVGTRKAGTKDPLYTITPIKSFKFAWIACSEALNGFKDKKSQVLLCFEQRQEILDLIKKIKSENLADGIIFLPHWGVEYSHERSTKQQKLAHDVLNEGAIAVIGSHPHVLQEVEKYVTKDNRETFIAYSLGNFVAFQRDIDRKTSALIYLDFEKNENGQAVISQYSYEPTTRSGTDIFPARHLKAVVNHVEKYLGPLQPQAADVDAEK